MRIVVTSQALTPWYGGSAISEASLCSHLGKNCEVTILCREGAVDYAFLQSFSLKDVREYRQREVVEAWRDPRHWLSRCIAGADVFHLNGHWRWENFFFARICVEKKIPYILHPRGMLLLGHRRIWLKRAFNWVLGNWIVGHASAVVALSRFELKQFQPYRTREGAQIVIPNGIIPRSDPRVLPPKENLPGRTPFFLFLGRIEARKNLLFLVDTFHRYISEGGQANLYLIGPVERNYDKAILGRVQTLGLERKVRLMPPVYEPERSLYFRKALAVIYPSFEEPFGRVPFEAIAAGGVPIVPDASGSAEYLQPFLPTCIYRHEDAESLLRAMKALEGQQTRDFEESLARARHWVEENLNWDNVTERVLKLYQDVAGDRKPALKSA
jgi:glycosyltransferase involved in cell wall biosynthesis